MDNFITLFSDPSYLETLRLTLVFSLATIVLTMGTALLFAVLADQVNWGGTLYKSMLIIPYAVAPPLAGVLWLFLFNPSGGVLYVEPQNQRQSGPFPADRFGLMETDLV